jgi:RND family efflux transporter MFP subunit
MERQVGTAKGSYQLALAQWEMKSGSPRLEDEILYSARVGQAQAGVKLAERRLEEAVLRAPFRGRVVEILKQEDEITQISQPVVRLRPLASFQIEADIYEGDIGQIEVGQDVQIELIAFPDIILSGQVSFVDSSSQLINNVVYYPIKVDLDDSDHNIQAGLTADIKVLLESRENVLTVPESSLKTEEGKTFVRVLPDQKEIEEKEVEAGMRGEGFRVEIISGLSAGEKVIVR